jgi:hypothetical protein
LFPSVPSDPTTRRQALFARNVLILKLISDAWQVDFSAAASFAVHKPKSHLYSFAYEANPALPPPDRRENGDRAHPSFLLDNHLKSET